MEKVTKQTRESIIPGSIIPPWYLLDFLFDEIMKKLSNNILQNQWIKIWLLKMINNIDKL